MSDNPYVNRGIVLTPEDFNLASTGLTVMAAQADKENHPEISARCVKLIVRLQGCQFAGAGMTPEAAERYHRRIYNAMQTGNPEAISRGLTDLIAAMIRIDADPAEKIGEMLSELTRVSIAATTQAKVVEWLDELSKTLADASAEWASGEWPSAADVMQWVTDTVSAGVVNVRNGHAPWVDGADAASEEPATS